MIHRGFVLGMLLMISAPVLAHDKCIESYLPASGKRSAADIIKAIKENQNQIPRLKDMKVLKAQVLSQNGKIIVNLIVETKDGKSKVLPFEQSELPNVSIPRTSLLTSNDRLTLDPATGPTVSDLKLAHEKNGGTPILAFEKVDFKGVEGFDVYNSPGPLKTKFEGEDITVVPGRVEKRDVEKAQVMFFRSEDGTTKKQTLLEGTPVYDNAQDPFYTTIDGELFLGFVQTVHVPGKPIEYHTVIYRDHGQGIDKLVPFFQGPPKMKDIRIGKLKDGKIKVVGRPQGAPDKGGLGMNSVTEIDNVNELTADVVANATLLKGQVDKNDWIGTNEVHALSNGKAAYLAHIAEAIGGKSVDHEGNWHPNRGYYAATWADSDLTPRIFLTVDDFTPEMLALMDYKRDDLIKVIFSGKLERNADGTAWFTFGLGDAQVWRVLIPDPVLRYERN